MESVSPTLDFQQDSPQQYFADAAFAFQKALTWESWAAASEESVGR
jgi:hypothetical protein